MSAEPTQDTGPRREFTTARPPAADTKLYEAYELLESAALRGVGEMDRALLAFAPALRDALKKGDTECEAVRSLLDRFSVNTYRVGQDLGVAVPLLRHLGDELAERSACLDSGLDLPGPRESTGARFDEIRRLGNALQRVLTIVERDTGSFRRIDAPANYIRVFSVALACGLETGDSFIPASCGSHLSSKVSPEFKANDLKAASLAAQALLNDRMFTGALKNVGERPLEAPYTAGSTGAAGLMIEKIERAIGNAYGVILHPGEPDDEPLEPRIIVTVPYMGLMSSNLITFRQYAEHIDEDGPARATASALILGTAASMRGQIDTYFSEVLVGGEEVSRRGTVLPAGAAFVAGYELDIISLAAAKVHGMRTSSDTRNSIVIIGEHGLDRLDRDRAGLSQPHIRSFALDFGSRFEAGTGFF